MRRRTRRRRRYQKWRQTTVSGQSGEEKSGKVKLRLRKLERSAIAESRRFLRK